METVNVLMSTYNGEKYLEEQIQSIINQKGVNVILTVRDDGSNDSTISILESYMERGVLKYYQGQNVRPAKSFMDLVRNASDYNYYAFCDQDDVWKPDKLIRAITCLDEYDSNEPLLYSANFKLVDASLKPISGSTHVTETNYETAIVSCCVTGCTAVFNKKLQALLKAYTPEYQGMHDSWAGRVCLAVGGKLIFDKDYEALLYRQHGNNVLGGTKNTLSDRVKRFFKNATRKECAISRQAEELLNGYSEFMSKENLALTKLVANYRCSFLSWMKLLTTNKIKMDNRTSLILFRLKVFFRSL